MPSLYIELGKGQSQILQFQVLDTPLAGLWLERMEARVAYPLDHPDRFYGFGSAESEKIRAEGWIRDCIKTINRHEHVITRPFTNVHDQDCLNYLHNIFERYHGLLDQQANEFWVQAPDAVRHALADLNLAIHCCESLRGTYPRFVCTWFGLPKTKTLPMDIMQRYGQLAPAFGTVCLNYVEIGKTFEELAYDQDEYIGDNAFVPFTHYSADFNVKFFTQTKEQIDIKLDRMRKYYNEHRGFFAAQGFQSFDDPRLLPLQFPVAQLVEIMPGDQLLSSIAQKQYIKKVWIE